MKQFGLIRYTWIVCNKCIYSKILLGIVCNVPQKDQLFGHKGIVSAFSADMYLQGLIFQQNFLNKDLK